MNNVRAGNGKCSGLNDREQIEEELEGDVGRRVSEVIEHFQTIPSGSIAVVIKFLLAFRCREFDEFLPLLLVCRKMGQQLKEIATGNRLEVEVRGHAVWKENKSRYAHKLWL